MKSTVGQTAMLTCLVTAYPEPHMMWWKDVEGKVEIISGDHHLIRTVQEVSYISIQYFMIVIAGQWRFYIIEVYN